MNEYTLFFDTNALLELQERVFSEPFIVCSKSMEEIEHIKTSSNKDAEVKYKARKIAKLLDEHWGEYRVSNYTYSSAQDILYEFGLEESNDSLILATAYLENSYSPILFVSNDINCKCLAKMVFKLKTKNAEDLNLVNNIQEYKGFESVTMSDEELAEFYLNQWDNRWNLKENEYLLLFNQAGELIDKRKWDGSLFVPLKYDNIRSKFLGLVKPRNEHQALAFDMLQDEKTKIKVISGKMGSGKDYIMISNALRLIEKGLYERIVWVRNTVEVKDTKPIGFLPGTMNEKLWPFSMILADHLGGVDGLEMMINEGKICLEHLGFIRGRDFKNSILICSESENMTKEHIQLLMGRIGEGSALWLNGDFKQTDDAVFRSNSGLTQMIKTLAGHSNFGFVQLQKTERSATAAMADLLD